MCRRGQQFTLGEIGAGTYTLFFVLGEDWNQAEQAFRQDDTYSQFQKPLTFTETSTRTDTDNGYRIGTRYSTFTVTLNPVPTGTARTTRISKAAFDALR